MIENKGGSTLEKKKSFINRKRPAVKGLVEDFLEETGELDETVLGKLPPRKKGQKKFLPKKKISLPRNNQPR